MTDLAYDLDDVLRATEKQGISEYDVELHGIDREDKAVLRSHYRLPRMHPPTEERKPLRPSEIMNQIRGV